MWVWKHEQHFCRKICTIRIILEGNENNNKNGSLRKCTIFKMCLMCIFFYIPSGRKAVDINSRKNYQKGKSGHFVDLIYILRSLYSIILLNYSVVNHQTFLEIRYALEIQLWRQCRRKIRGLIHLKFKKKLLMLRCWRLIQVKAGNGSC